MRMNQFLLLVVATFIACCSTLADAERSIQVNTLTTDSITESATEGHRYLKGSKATTDLDTVDEERIGATTPNFGILKALFKLPKFESLSKLPVIKQLAAAKKKFGKKIVDYYLKRERKRYESNPQNFM
uniref:RxLR effector protein n=1 Tax=Phytophthora lateralis TaxID=129355 RepID=C0J5H7_9STRA|nr:putative effector protein Avh121 [Phytophthora lateralis]QTJ63965.1 putative effector protein Avh121 [Phytophthora lateralis]